MSRRFTRLNVMLLVLSLVLAAFSSGSEKEADAISEDTGTNATKVVRDLFGDVTIPVKPQNMLVMDSIYAEYLIEMGVKPQMVAFVPEIEPEYRAPYFEEHTVQMVQSEQYQYNYEQLLALSPDMIVTMGAGMEQSVYDELSKIAPTVALDANAEMDEAMPKLAAIFDKQAESAQALAEFNEKAKQAREQIAQAIGNKTVLVLRVEHNRYRFMGPKGGSSSVFLACPDLGRR
ncbi:ABC transporter substrate-binding protein [Paenibacillus sp. QZ-Y1]|uniref:ABC transporter substrate-binding protein n=1 Tax=Paenibacillus sp. QZ-Y1 TaxID=3414511 RepID=UPI003F7B0973